MKSEGLLLWLYEHILNQYFGNDIGRMAQEIHFSEKALKKALHDEGSREALELFEQLMGYFHENNISMDALLVQYTKERKR